MNPWADAAHNALIMLITPMSAAERERWLANVEKQKSKCRSGKQEIDALLAEVRAVMAAYPPKS